MNISISTTQWGDIRQPTIRNASSRKPATIGRNLVLALLSATLVGFFAIQALGYSDFDNRLFLSDVAEGSAKVESSGGFFLVEEMGAEEFLWPQLSREELSPDTRESTGLAKYER